MTLEFRSIKFPARDGLSSGHWRPILLRPHPDSPDQFVVGVVAWTTRDFFCAAADAARRIHCLFPDGAQTILLAQKSAMNSIEHALSKEGPEALDRLSFKMSGISLGPIQVAEARDAKSMAHFWLGRISSLHQKPRSIGQDRYDEKKNPDLIDFFSSDIRFKARRIAKPAPQKVIVGFAGKGVVANFATLKPSRSRIMIDHVKRLMWDLSRARDGEVGLLPVERRFEMVVFRRPIDDPELTRKQDAQLREMIHDLSEQGAKDDIGLQSRDSVDGIATYIATMEKRVAPAIRA
ncbi:MAG: hypothetical protein ACK4IB_07380 [Erythrobacter sp.]